LSRTKALFVIARNSSFAYKGKSPDIRQVGQELGVRYVLEGSVRKAGNRVRITGQLIDAVTPMPDAATPWPGERGLVTQDNWSKGALWSLIRRSSRSSWVFLLL
jgi:TolB-like protein